MTPDERRYLYEQFLRCIDREENLIHHRLSWGLQWSAAILTAMFALSKLEIPDEVALSIRLALSFFGGLSGYLSFVGVNAAYKQSNYLIDGLEDKLIIRNDMDWERSEFLRPFGQRGSVHLPARKAAIRFPWLFMVIWSGFFFYTLLQFLTVLRIIVIPALQHG